MRLSAAIAGLACALVCVCPRAFGLMGEPREYEEWTTQEWSQHGQYADKRRLYQPDFSVISAPQSWRTTDSGTYVGEITTQYWPEISNGGYGFAFGARNQNDGRAQFDIFLLPDGKKISSTTLLSAIGMDLPCHLVGSLMIVEGTPVVITEAGFTAIGALMVGAPSCPFDSDIFSFFGLQIRQLLRRGQYPMGFPFAYDAAVQNQTVYSVQPYGGGNGFTGGFYGRTNRTAAAPVVFSMTGDILLADEQRDYGWAVDACGNAKWCSRDNVSSPSRCSASNITVMRQIPGEWMDYDFAWTVTLRAGEAVCGDVPAGTPPPADPIREYRIITAPAVYRNDLMVVGAALNTLRGDYVYYDVGALVVFDPKIGGKPLWTFHVDGELIMPDPVILGNAIIFGTNRGRVFALTHSGKLLWYTSDAARLRYQPYPYTSPAIDAEVALYGPAVDLSGNYVYFGGSDGRVHRFDVGTGGALSSEVLNYYRSNDYDYNGLQVIKPCPIRCAPAVSGNEFLIVKSSTENLGSNSNGSFISVLRLPDLARNKEIAGIAPDPALFGMTCCIDPDTAEFVCAANRYGTVPMGNYVLTSFDTVRLVTVISNPGSNFMLYRDSGDGIQTDTGGVSLAEGFVLAGNAGGQAVGIPSCRNLDRPYGGDSPIAPPPPAYSMPPAPDPIRVYPNPYDPAKAVNGALKFINLPAGSRVVIYTLAYEEVAIIHESGNRAEWLGRNAAGQEVASGVYLYKVFTPAGIPSVTGRIALVRR